MVKAYSALGRWLYRAALLVSLASIAADASRIAQAKPLALLAVLLVLAAPIAGTVLVAASRALKGDKSTAVSAAAVLAMMLLEVLLRL